MSNVKSGSKAIDQQIAKQTAKKIAKNMLLEIMFVRWWARVAMILISGFAAIMGVLAPFFQKEFIDRLSGASALSTFSPELQAALPQEAPPFLAFAFICLVLNLGCLQFVNYLGAREAIYIQRLWAQRLYERILELRTDSLADRQLGEIVAIYATDLPGATILLEQSLPQMFSILFPLILAPFLIVMLFHTPIATTLEIISGIILMNLMLAFRQSRFFYTFKKLAADRLGLVNEWVQNIRTLRILGWVRAFERRIIHIREVETKNRIAMLNNGQTMNAVASSITFVLNLTLISSLVYNSLTPVTPGALLALLWVVAVFLTRPFRQMPWLFTFLFDGTSSLNRAAALFAVTNQDGVSREEEFKKLKDMSAQDPAMEVKNLNLQIGGQSILKDVSFTIAEGEFIAVVGEVGSGKSMLLLSLLAETGATFGSYQIGANDARTMNVDQLRQFFTFVPQEGFIMSATLRENVAFEYDVHGNVDSNVLQSLARSQFVFEQERIKDGLDTEIGERGVNLSGGQKQRVSLARVDYYQAPILLLDDCLSAVDVDTEKKIMKSLLLGDWKHRTRILATHRLTILEKTDRVFFLKNGILEAQGKYSHLLKTNAEFREYTASVAREEASTKRENPEDSSVPIEAVANVGMNLQTGEE